MAWLEIKKLEAYYHREPVLHGVDLMLDAQGFASVIGSNGAGKTTLLRSISRLIRIKGTIRIGDTEISNLSPKECVRQGIIHCPEGRLLFPDMTVHQNLMMGAFARHDKVQIRRDLDRVYAYLPVLDDRNRQIAGTLSGGEQQMLAVGRAIMGSPKLLTLDEPSFGLAPLVVATIFEVVQKLNDDGVTVLLVEQNAALAIEYSRFVYVLEEGRIVESGPSGEVAKISTIARTYLGMS